MACRLNRFRLEGPDYWGEYLVWDDQMDRWIDEAMSREEAEATIALLEEDPRRTDRWYWEYQEDDYYDEEDYF